MIDIPSIRKEWFLEQLEELRGNGVSNKAVAKQIGVLPQYINNIKNGNRGVSENFVLKFCNAFSINHNDLLKRIRTYESAPVPISINEPPENHFERKKIPFFDEVETIGGVNNKIADVSTPHMTPSEWIDAGDWFPDATSAIRHYGESMVEYPSGSILVLRRVLDKRLILWGRNYSIETTEFRVTKRLQDGGDEYVMAYSSNTNVYPDGKLIHEPLRIPKETIRHIDLVIGCVTKEYSNGSIPIISRKK